MTFDEEIVQDKLKLILKDILFNKITDFKAVMNDKNKLWAIINSTDWKEILEHDDLPVTNFTALVKMGYAELNNANPNWKILNKIAEELRWVYSKAI